MHDEKKESDDLKGPTMYLAAINVIFYIFTSILGGSFLKIGRVPLILFGLSWETFSRGFIWTPFTSIITHSGLAHIGMNMIFLFIYGFKLEEEKYNTKQIIIAYVITGLLSGFLSMFFVNGFQVGSSGAVFGILGVNYGVQKKVNDPNAKKVLFASIILFVMTSTGANTNIFAHFIGLISGIILGKSDFFANLTEFEQFT